MIQQFVEPDIHVLRPDGSKRVPKNLMYGCRPFDLSIFNHSGRHGRSHRLGQRSDMPPVVKRNLIGKSGGPYSCSSQFHDLVVINEHGGQRLAGGEELEGGLDVRGDAGGVDVRMTERGSIFADARGTDVSNSKFGDGITLFRFGLRFVF